MNFRYLANSDNTIALALVPRRLTKKAADQVAAETAFETTLIDALYDLDPGRRYFCVRCADPLSPYSGEHGGPIKVITIPGGYFLHFRWQYCLDPTEMDGPIAAED